MSISCDAAGRLQSSLLQLDIVSGIPLPMLTAQVNGICEQAEENEHGVVLLRFASNNTDWRAWPGEVAIQDINRWERALRRLERFANAIVMMASGMAGGPALELFLISDYRITTADFRLKIPVNAGHVWPGMAMYRLVNQVGVARGRQLLMRHSEVTAQHAFNIGLIDEIAENIHAAVDAALLRFSSMPATELAIRRQLLLEALTTTFEDAMGTHLAACDRELRRLHKEQQ